MSVSLLEARIDLAEALALRSIRRMIAGEGGEEKNSADLVRYDRCVQNLISMRDDSARESHRTQDYQNIRHSWHNYNAVRNPRRDK